MQKNVRCLWALMQLINKKLKQEIFTYLIIMLLAVRTVTTFGFRER